MVAEVIFPCSSNNVKGKTETGAILDKPFTLTWIFNRFQSTHTQDCHHFRDLGTARSPPNSYERREGAIKRSSGSQVCSKEAVNKNSGSC